MFRKTELCKSDSKLKAPVIRGPGGRCSLQVDNFPARGRRSSSLDSKPRGSGGLVKPRSLSDERKSLFPVWNSGRKSSLNLERKLTKDPRQLTDKAYQRKKITELIEYLKEKDFKIQLTVSRLMQPSKKDFEMIFTHFAADLVPQIEVKKMEEDVIKILKILYYPFIPNKSTFQYVARTNWPPLLGVLLYMMDILKFLDNLEVNIFSLNQAENSEQHAVFFHYIWSCYFNKTDEDDEEMEAAVFSKIIMSKFQCSTEELQEQLEAKKKVLLETDNQVMMIKDFCKREAETAKHISLLEAFIPELKSHIAKRTEESKELASNLAAKESEIVKLKEMIAEKQALYDAQKVDGRKQLTYFKTQQEDLTQKFQAKQEAFKELQNKCWEVEMQYSLTYDKGVAVCEEFNELYARVAESFRNVRESLQSTGDPQIRNILSNTSINFPACRMEVPKPFQHCQSLKSSLDNLKREVDSFDCIFKGLADAQNQKLQDCLLKKSEISVKLKVASSNESQMGRDFTIEEKLLKEKMKSLEDKCQQAYDQLETIRKERELLVNENEEFKKSLEKVTSSKEEKIVMLDDYIAKQKNFFEKMESALQRKITEIKNCDKILTEEVLKVKNAVSEWKNEMSKPDEKQLISTA